MPSLHRLCAGQSSRPRSSWHMVAKANTLPSPDVLSPVAAACWMHSSM